MLPDGRIAPQIVNQTDNDIEPAVALEYCTVPGGRGMHNEANRGGDGPRELARSGALHSGGEPRAIGAGRSREAR